MPDETSELEKILTPTQFTLVGILAAAKGRFITTPTVIWRLWQGDEPEQAENSLTTHIYRIREKLGEGVIESKLGFGYRWAG